MRSAASRVPRISVVVPAYNAAAYIREALDSALTQSWPPYQVLVQDGESTDATLDILRSYGDRVSWVSERDGGQSDALNRGFARATGDVVGWLNADDRYVGGALELVAGAFASQPSPDFVYGDFHIIDSAGSIRRIYHSSAFCHRRIFLRGNYIFSGSTFFRRNLLEMVGPFDVTLNCCMDLDYFLRLPVDAHAVRVNGVVGELRMHATNKSTNLGWTFIREAIRVRRRHSRGSRMLGTLTYLVAARHLAYQLASSFRYSRVWSRIRRERSL